MSLHRRAAKRDQSEKAIVETLRACGWSVLQVSVKDGPDLFATKRVVRRELCGSSHSQYRTVAIECKTGKRKLKPGQDAFRKNWAGEYVVLRSVEDVLALNGGQE